MGEDQQNQQSMIEIHIVDDNETNVILLSEILSNEGYSIRVSTNGEQAIESIRAKLPFIVLLDIRLPDMDGFEVCRKLKEDESTCNVPVIFISALVTEQYKVVGFKNGGVDFISKPFRKEEVLARIRTHVKLSMTILELEVQKCQLIAEIEERKIAEEKLRESEDRYLAFINSNKDMIFVKDDQFRYLILNDAMANFFGKNKEEMLGKCDAELADSNVIFPCSSSDRKALESTTAFVVQEKLGDRICETTKFQLQLNGNRKGIGGIIHDITERENIANGLKESEEKFRNMADFSPVAIGIYQDDEWVYINPAAVEMSGYTKEEILSRKFWEFADSDYHEFIRNNGAARQFGDEQPKSYELKIQTKNGDSRWVYLKGSGIKYNGRPAGIVSIIDISEKMKAEKEIQAERLLLRTLIDNLPDPIYVKDSQARKLLANLADVQNIGFENEAEVLGKTDLELFGDIKGKQGFEEDMEVIHNARPMINCEKAFSNHAGIQRWFLTSKIPLLNPKGKSIGLVGIGRDITEMKKAEEQIKKLTKSIEQSPSTIVITDVLGNIEYVNPKFTEITGYTAEEVLGQNPRILKSGKNPDEVYIQMWNAISHGDVWRGEFQNRKKNGEYYWEWATMTSIKNEDGLITNYIAIKEDISVRKQMESDLIIARNKALESDKLKSAFLANMSHEIRTPLNSIIGFSELLGDDDFSQEDKKEFIQHIVDNGNSLLNIISDIMDVSKMESGEIRIRKSPVNVSHIIKRIRDQFMIKFKEKGLEFQIENPQDDLNILVLADEDRIIQVLTNLISNALKFTHDGYIQISFKRINQMAQLSVQDTGIGIPVEYHAKIFDRFSQVESSATRKYGGNGLGLAITKNLVELMGGKIWLESESGQGATFHFLLPLYVND